MKKHNTMKTSNLLNFRTLLFFGLNVSKVSSNKYCSLESDGEPKYFICARNEYCCHFGCCVHLAFQFYQLWYYWLLLIFIFMVCTGGTWWYRICRQHPSATGPSVERQNRQTGPAEIRRNRLVGRRSASNSVYFQRMWKTNGVGPPPNYYTASVVRYHSASELETRRQQQECPYFQLYGPPPSYESVVRIPEDGNGQASCALVRTQQNQREQQPKPSTSSQSHQEEHQTNSSDKPSTSQDNQSNPGPSTSHQVNCVANETNFPPRSTPLDPVLAKLIGIHEHQV